MFFDQIVSTLYIFTKILQKQNCLWLMTWGKVEKCVEEAVEKFETHETKEKLVFFYVRNKLFAKNLQQSRPNVFCLYCIAQTDSTLSCVLFGTRLQRTSKCFKYIIHMVKGLNPNKVLQQPYSLSKRNCSPPQLSTTPNHPHFSQTFAVG